MVGASRAETGAAHRKIRRRCGNLPSREGDAALSKLRRAGREARGDRLLAAIVLRALARHSCGTTGGAWRRVRNAGSDMTDSFDLILQGGLCATPSGLAEADIG